MKNDWNEFESKLGQWRKISKGSATLRMNGEPLFFRYLWKKKIKIPPPYFINPILLTIGFGTLLSPIWIPLGYSEGLDILECLVLSYVLGFMIAMIFYCERKVRRLPDWKDL